MSRTLTVLRTWVIREGSGDKGPWTLRGVEATNSKGDPIVDQLKTFADLRPGEVEVDVERQEHEQYGVSYLLKPLKGAAGARNSGGAELAELRRRIGQLESEVKRHSSLLDRRHDDTYMQPVAGIPEDLDDIPF